MNKLMRVFPIVALALTIGASAQAIDVSSYALPVDPAHRGAEIAEIHPAFDFDPEAADFGGKKIPGQWRSNGLVTGAMGIVRFGPAIAAYVCFAKNGQEFCPPFTSGVGGARMTRMQSDAVTIEYSPFAGVRVAQTTMAVNAHLLRSRLRISGAGVKATLMGSAIQEDETGHLKDFERHTAPREANTMIDGVPYTWRMSPPGGTGGVIEFSLGFGPESTLTSAAATAPFDRLLDERARKSTEFYARVPNFDFHDAPMNLFHRIMWERLRALAENAAGNIPYPFFMGTSAPWGIDGLWLWDAAFVSEVLRYRDPVWAGRLIEAVLAQQDASGFVDHWTTPHGRSAISQPPLLSWAAYQLYIAHGDRAFLERVYPKLASLHRWFEKDRTRPDGLPFWKQPDESGMDNSPAFDDGTDAHVDLVVELFADAGYLHEIARVLGREEDARQWDAQEKTWRTRMDRFWDPAGQFYFPFKGASRVPVYAIQGLFPLWDPELPREKRAALIERLKDPAEFWTPFPVPSVSLKSPQFMKPKWFANTTGSPETGQRIGDKLADYSSVYWRGPVWVFSNAIIYGGLRRSGEFAIANELGDRMVRMMFEGAKHGATLWENFDPHDGLPSRLLPSGQSDEMAASIYYLKTLYDSRIGLESVEAPSDSLLHLRYTAAPKADVSGLRFGPWTISQTVHGSTVNVSVQPKPGPNVRVSIEDRSGAGLRIVIAGRP